MAKLYIREYSQVEVVGAEPVNVVAQIAQEPGTDQTPVVIGGGSLQSVAFAASTRLVRIHTDAICSVLFGPNPTATVNSARLAADQTEYFGVNPGDKVAVISNT